MRKEIIRIDGPGCRAILECKEWKQGTRIYCPIMGRGVVNYPNRGFLPRIALFCENCENLKAKGSIVVKSFDR